LRNGIAQFVGSWVSQFGYRLRVEKVRRDRAVVDFLDPRGAPIVRPYMGGAPSMKMIAHYDDYNEDFRVDLWEESKGFILHLDHEYGYVLDPEQRGQNPFNLNDHSRNASGLFPGLPVILQQSGVEDCRHRVAFHKPTSQD